jgi:ribonuclease T2
VNCARALAAVCAAVATLAAGAPECALAQSRDDAPFDYYVLALSWAPTFCEAHPADRPECGLRRGFVVHGLWPQYAGGGGPEHCAGADALDPETIRRAKPAMPDERLIRHEWVVHGTCSALSPQDYFETVIRAIGRLSIPAEFDGKVPQTMTAAQIVSAFVKANPSLTARSIAVSCRGSQFEEVRICLARDLRPEQCGRDVRSHCGKSPVMIGTMH